MKFCEQLLSLPVLCAGLVIFLTSCHSAVVDATIVNQGPALRVVEFDYPSASFGTNVLPSGGRYHYRFKIQGSGPITLHFEDSKGQSHTAEGPVIQQGQEGSITATIADDNSSVHWDLKLSGPK